ncbi:MAG: hypothetical protein PHD48_10175 [Alphaproteobacteria bacterium]|nr:hypothetical protein [Alphaproteobacteria bacterium]
MKDLVASGEVTVRILATKSNFKSSFAKYKFQPAGHMAPTAFYAFGDCLALVSFEHDDPPYVVLHKSGPFAQAYIQAFNLAWENAQAV